MRFGIDYRDDDGRRIKRDLQEIEKAADRFGANRGADKLGRDLREVSRTTETTRRDVDTLRRAVDRFGASRGADEMAQRFRRLGIEVDRTDRDIDQLRASAERLGRVGGIGSLSRDIAMARTRFGGLNQELGILNTGAGNAFNALMAFAAPTAILAGLSQVEQKFRDVDAAAGRTAMTAERYGIGTRKELVETNKALGRDVGASQGSISDARQTFVAGGMTIAEQNTALPPTLRAAIGSGASAETIARAGRAYLGTMGGKAEELPAAYDIMAKGGKLGSFELEALAKNLPSLGSQYAAAGGTGLKGLSELVALAEIAAKGAGSEDEAANNLQNYLAKLFSPETVGNFKKRRVNLPREIEAGRQRGEHPALTVLDLATEVTGGDPFRMGELFGDQQVMAALRPLMQNRDLLTKYEREIRTESAGTVERDYEYYRTMPQGMEEARQADREASQLTIGEAVSPGRARASEAYTALMKDLAGSADKTMEEGPASGAWDLLRKFNPLFGGDFGLVGRYFLKGEGDGSGEEVGPDAAVREPAERDLLRRNRDDAEARLGVLREQLSEAEGESAEADALRRQVQGVEERLQEINKTLEEGFSSLKDETVSPISFGSDGFGGGRIINASLGGGGRGGSGAPYRSAYAGAPQMDGFAGMGSPGRGPSANDNARFGASSGALTNPGGAKGEIFDVLSADFSDPQAFALLGHMEQESGFDPNAWNAGEQAGGLLQWRGNRLANLQQFASSRGMDWRDRKVQAAFVAYEMQNDPYERRRSKRFREANTVEEASAALEDYVRFGDGSGGQRLANARRAAGEFGAGATAGAAAFGGVQLDYANQGATRNRPITDNLYQSIQEGIAAVYGPGYRGEIYSGGQAGRRRTGSRRHDDHGHGGRASDTYIYGPDGKRLEGDDLAPLAQWWLANRKGSVGLEMSGGGIHLDEITKDQLKSGESLHWDYGRLTRKQAEAVRQGLSGVQPDAAAKMDAAAAHGADRETFAKDGWPEDDAKRPAPKAKSSMPKPAAAEEASGGTVDARTGGNGQPVVTNHHYHGVDPQVMAAKAARRQRRDIAAAQARAMHDTEARVA
ncbi:prophage MuMc02, tail tape measure protein, TP901 family [Fulvimarina pelagi HTCC2506]|uniref:Prophage MuMc02, tail tape measure protein, TP901 family n=2 Tax=Fulvimarina pelagi TaxID=217511 RepID=Q0FZ15_9HYPH|nr:prophage MuMc02, tail tape measure protein, TP901 family [Fulvimarina pelagi HTCC2506]